MSNKPNRLIKEKSPYLLQHAYNPVNWYPWGDEAFEKAREEDKPIFLSIGYSTCYWCHVMEREVFENEEIAEEMNRIFINIKLDREERPDIDRIYMAALQAMTGSGGWPMSMFLNHELKPFYGATYIPPYPKHGIPGFINVIRGIEEAWRLRRNEINNTGDKIIKYIGEVSENKFEDAELTEEILSSALNQFRNSFDEEYGGFGSAPKFPRPPGINFLLRVAYRYNDKESLDMAFKTLNQMIRGGIYDHIGGGFHRYSVDRYWHVPHFEKMLYDQAQLCVNYTEAFQLTANRNFEETVKETLDYVKRVLTSPDGGFYSAEDAESAVSSTQPDKKSEGAFYVWTKNEIDEALGDYSEIFCFHYGVDEYGNVRSSSDPHGVLRGKNVLYVPGSLKTTSEKFSLSEKETLSILTECRRKLFLKREKRPRPHLDDKVLTNWNALMISAFSKAYQVFGDKDYLNTAVKAAEFVINHLIKDDQLYHRYRDGDVDVKGLLEDYAFFVNSL
ncbi:MAG: thioredoxin domain-containing protein, partial [Ignavibacteria bacterium]|nr:thioredoxin domain-containing protein [Ignavibacteria bacterium]